MKSVKVILYNAFIFLSPFFDLVRAPALIQLVWRVLAPARPLRPEESDAGQAVLGADGIRYTAVRVAQGGLAGSIFARNGRRAFTLYRTVNLPDDAPLDIVVHELAHVVQYERAGGRYMWEALRAQTLLDDAYDYGGAEGLVAARRAARHFSEFNREQQAKIAQDYYARVIEGNSASLSAEQREAYDFYRGELVAGRV